MTKAELVGLVALDADMAKIRAEAVINAALDLIARELAGGGKVNLTPLGGFEARDVPARTGRNPKTGEAMTIEASRTVKFTPAKSLKEAVNQDQNDPGGEDDQPRAQQLRQPSGSDRTNAVRRWYRTYWV
jgi:DNA-binding protein HU-beta